MKSTLACCFFLVTIVVLFLHPLFWPKLQLIVTPSLGHGDSTYFSLPNKYLLWKNLHTKQNPYWDKNMGSGFPLLGEGQIGAFFLPNQLLYRLPSFPLAYNLSILLAISLFAVGFYFLFKSLDFSNLASLFASSTIALSGLTILNADHLVTLDGFGLLPWVILFTLKAIKSQRLIWFAVLALVVSQQIFAGHPQAVFITLSLAACVLIYYARKKLRLYIFFGISMALALGVGAIQLLPSYEFQKQTTTQSGYSQSQALSFSYPVNHLATFIYPYLLGDPKLGTYLFRYHDSLQLFWEDVGFFGTIPILIIGVGVIAWPLFDKSHKYHLKFWWLIVGGSFILMLGQLSPVFWIFSLPPMNLFRVPSRYIWTFVIGLGVIFALTLDNLYQRSGKSKVLGYFTIFLMVITIAQLYFVFGKYNLYYPADLWLAPPPVTKLLQNGRIFQIDTKQNLYNYYLKNGYRSAEPYYFARSEMAPDINLLWNISSLNAYAGRPLNRPTEVNNILQILAQAPSPSGFPNAQTLHWMEILSVKYVISDIPIKSTLATLEDKFSGASGDLFIYSLAATKPRAYLSSNIYISNTESAFADVVRTATQSGEVVVENLPQKINPSAKSGSVTFLKDTNTQIKLAVQSPDTQALILNDSYYPGWKATVDGQAVKIYPANINSRAIVINSGQHVVDFTYEPANLRLGTLISMGALIIIGFLLILHV